ncbi:hypothetical protein PanWU01x14_187170, partial [Parasponia andersonii]
SCTGTAVKSFSINGNSAATNIKGLKDFKLLTALYRNYYKKINLNINGSSTATTVKS